MIRALPLVLLASIAAAQGYQPAVPRPNPTAALLLSLTGAQSAATRTNPIPSREPFCLTADLLAQTDWEDASVWKGIVQLGAWTGANSLNFFRQSNTLGIWAYDAAGTLHAVAEAVLTSRLDKPSHRVSACWVPQGNGTVTGYRDGVLVFGPSTGFALTQPGTLRVGDGPGVYGTGISNVCISGPAPNVVRTGSASNDVANTCGQFSTGWNTAPVYGGILPASGATTVYCLGDSITYSGYGSGTPYPADLNARLGNQYNVINAGVNGNTVAQMKTRYEASARNYGRCVFLGGINDISTGATGANTLATASAILDEMRSDGCEPVVVLPTPANAALTAGQKTQYAAYSAGLSTYCSANSLSCIDTSSMGDGSGNLLSQYNGVDATGIHPNQAGLRVLGGLVAAAF